MLISGLKQLASVAPQAIPTKVYRLRWRFDFANKPSVIGTWDGAGKTHQAWKINKEGLIRAVIEGECRDTHEIETLFECDGHEYAFCQWLAYSRVRGVYGKNKGPISQLSMLSGITFLLRSYRVTVFVNGRIKPEPLTEQEALFKFKEHSA